MRRSPSVHELRDSGLPQRGKLWIGWIAEGGLRACRSEEHTSELQSQSNLVCRLLLEKKKKNDRYMVLQKWMVMVHPICPFETKVMADRAFVRSAERRKLRFTASIVARTHTT